MPFRAEPFKGPASRQFRHPGVVALSYEFFCCNAQTTVVEDPINGAFSIKMLIAPTFPVDRIVYGFAFGPANACLYTAFGERLFSLQRNGAGIIAARQDHSGG